MSLYPPLREKFYKAIREQKNYYPDFALIETCERVALSETAEILGCIMKQLEIKEVNADNVVFKEYAKIQDRLKEIVK